MAGAKFKALSATALAGRARRGKAAEQRAVRMQWFIKEVCGKVAMSMRNRVSVATELVQTKVIRNIGTPVTKGTGPRGGRVVAGRSKPGEFPHAETTHLQKSIFAEVKEEGKGNWVGYVGTPLSYGLILETRLNRSFLARTLQEERSKVRAILTGPIKA